MPASSVEDQKSRVEQTVVETLQTLFKDSVAAYDDIRIDTVDQLLAAQQQAAARQTAQPKL